MSFQIPEKIQNFFQRYPNAQPVYVANTGKAFLNSAYQRAMREAILQGEEGELYQVNNNLSFSKVYPEPIAEPEYYLRYTVVKDGILLHQGNVEPLNNSFNLGDVDGVITVTVLLEMTSGNDILTGVVPSGSVPPGLSVINVPQEIIAGDSYQIAQFQLNTNVGTYGHTIIAQTAGAGNMDVTFNYAVQQVYAPNTYRLNYSLVPLTLLAENEYSADLENKILINLYPISSASGPSFSDPIDLGNFEKNTLWGVLVEAEALHQDGVIMNSANFEIGINSANVINVGLGEPPHLIEFGQKKVIGVGIISTGANGNYTGEINTTVNGITFSHQIITELSFNIV